MFLNLKNIVDGYLVQKRSGNGHRHCRQEGEKAKRSNFVFGMQCELKNITLTSGEHHVVKREELLEAVLQNAYASAEMMPKSLIDEIYEKLYPLTQVGEIQKNKHIENIRKRYEKPVSSTKLPETQDKICPRCGGKLVLKVAKRGNYAGNKFYGCKNYPECKYIENIM